jgi:hypothetical protein
MICRFAPSHEPRTRQAGRRGPAPAELHLSLLSNAAVWADGRLPSDEELRRGDRAVLLAQLAGLPTGEPPLKVHLNKQVRGIWPIEWKIQAHDVDENRDIRVTVQRLRYRYNRTDL